MKSIVIIAILFAVASMASAQTIYCYPSAVASADRLYISFDNRAWRYSIPDLNLQVSRSYNQHLCNPATLNGDFVTFAASQGNTNSTDLRRSDLTVAAQRNSPAPFPPATNNLCFNYQGSSYCFARDNAANRTFVQRKNGDTVLESVQLPIPDANAYYFYFDQDIPGRIHLATNTGFNRGSTPLQYYAFSTGPLRITRGPIELPNTAGSGCPVEPASCTVPVLLSGTFSIRNDIVSYLWSIKNGDDYQVNIVTYDVRCNLFKTVRLGASLPPAARCLTQPPATTTQQPTRDCWTCGPGYVHWYDIPGYPEPADKCACVLTPATTTRSPTTTRGPTTQQPTRNCWTCGPGYVHWYDIPGYPEPADKCACVLIPATTTRSPTTTRTPTTTQPTRNCWTCLPGYVHWYDIPGFPEPADKCACVLSSSTTTRAPTTTRGPTTTQPTRNCWTCLPGYVHWYDIPGFPEPADKCACVLRPGTTTTGSPTTTTRGPTTQQPTRNCWTCLPGYVHWYDIPGFPEPADKCACVLSSITTTRGPTTQQPTRNCWTCLPGYVHWYDIPGYPEPADKCACVLSSSTTTRAPTTTRGPTTQQPTRNCWTCLPGYVHWYDIPGFPEPADKCACVLSSSTTTRGPTTQQPTRNCWTCLPGYVHWYDIPGFPEPADKCACVPTARSRSKRGLASRIHKE